LTELSAWFVVELIRTATAGADIGTSWVTLNVFSAGDNGVDGVVTALATFAALIALSTVALLVSPSALFLGISCFFSNKNSKSASGKADCSSEQALA